MTEPLPQPALPDLTRVSLAVLPTRKGRLMPKPVEHRVCGGIFTPDPDIPADHRERRTCRCGLVGEPGDAHHTPPAQADADHGQLAAGDQTND